MEKQTVEVLLFQFISVFSELEIYEISSADIKLNQMAVLFL